MKTLLQSLFVKVSIAIFMLNCISAGKLLAQTLPAGGGTYTIDNTLGATFSGGNSGNFATPASAVTAINNLGATSLTNNVVFNVTAGANGSFSTAELDITFTHSNGHTITFINSVTPGTNNPVWTGTGTANTAVVALKSADNIIFNGIDFTTTASTGCSWGVVLLGGVGDGCQGNIVENCKISNFTNTTASSGALLASGSQVGAGIIASSSATNAAGENNTNHFYNNWVTNVVAGYSFTGVSATFPDNDNEVGISGTGVSKITSFGIVNANGSGFGTYFFNQTNFKVFNTLMDDASVNTNNGTFDAIYSSGAAVNTGNIFSNTISNIASSIGSTLIGVYTASLNTSTYNNLIYNISNPSTGGSSFTLGVEVRGGTTAYIYNNVMHTISSGVNTNIETYGILVAFSAPTYYIYNNMIYDITANKNGTPVSSGGVFTGGIWCNTGTGYIYNNTIYLNGVSTAATHESAALFQYSSTVKLDVRNNILYNNYTGTLAHAVAFYRYNNTYTNLSANCNNNLLYAGSSTTDPTHLLLYDQTHSSETISDYKTYINSVVSGAETNAVTGDPGFVSLTTPIDVHIVPCTSTSPALYRGNPVSTSGTPVAPISITTDIDGNTRGTGTTFGSSPAPTIGADEIYAISVSSNTPTNPALCGGNGSIQLNGNLAAYTTYAVTYNPSGSTNYTTDGSGNLIISPLAAGTYSNFVLTLGSCSSTAYPVSSGTIVLSAPCGPTVYSMSANGTTTGGSAGSVCPSGTIGMANSDASVTYKLIKNGNTGSPVQSLSSGPGAFNFTYSPLVAGDVYTVIAVDVSSNSTNMTGSVTINPLPTTPTTPSGATSRCQGIGTNVYTTSSTGAASYTWSVNGGSNSISGTGTSATVTWDATFNGNAAISVTATNTCGTTPSAGTVNVAINPGSLSAPSTPSGTTTRCIGSGTDIYTASSAGATSYNWSITGGANSISGTTSTGTVNWDAAFSGTATVSVTATNGCGTSSPTILNVAVNTAPSTPSNPSGTTSRCLGAGSDTYTSSVGGASSYNWSVTTAAGSISGTGTSANVTWSPTYTGTATVSVSATNTCGTSSAAITSVTVVTIPLTPSAPSGTTSRCVGANTTPYTTSATGATSYNWSVTGSGNSVSGTSSSANVTWAAGFVGTGTVSVTASNTCGTSSSASTIVTVNGLNGTYAINNTVSGAGNLYPNTNVFNSFRSAVAAMVCGIGGPVLFNVAPGTYNEQVSIPAFNSSVGNLGTGPIPGASATNTITFDGGNAATTLLDTTVSAISNGVLNFNGCTYVTVKNLAITNTSTGSSGYGVVFYGQQYNFTGYGSTCDHDQVLNCIINVPIASAASDLIGIAFGCTSAATACNGNFTNNKVDGCKINNGSYGILINGIGSGRQAVYSNVISNNQITNYFNRGIYESGSDACKILNNTLSTNSTNSSGGVSGNYGIYVSGCNSITSPAHDNIDISGNTIYNFKRYGLFISASPAAAVSSSDQYTRVSNNFIGGSLSTPITTVSAGLAVTGTYDCNIWHNSCNLNLSAGATFGAFYETGNNTLDIRDNIFEYSGASSGSGQPMYSTSTTSITIDYNLLYNTNNPTGLTTSGLANQSAFIGSTQYYGTGAFPAAGSNAVYADPQFVNPASNLDITFQCTRGIDAGITTDIHGNTRPYPGQTKPSMGADEIGPSIVGAAGIITGSNSICAVQNGVAYSVSPITFATGYNWTVPTGASIVSGSNTNSITVNYPVTASSGNVIVQGINGACSGTSNTLPVAVNTTPTITITPSSGNICLGDVLPQTASGISATYTWAPSAGLNSNTGASVNTSPNVSTTYTVTGTTVQGCTGSATDVVLVRSLPPLVVTPNNAVCTGGTTATLVASGASIYTWSPTTNLTPSAGTTATETAQISALTIYTVTGTGSNGCTTNTTVPVATVAVGGTISAPFSIICSGTTKALSVIGAAGHDYQWQISTDNLTWTNITGATNTTYTTASGDGTTNKFYRLLAQSNSCWNVASTTAEVDVSVPTIPVTATGITDNSLTLNWSPVGTGNYTISYSGPTSATLTSVTPSKTITGLIANGAYSITVTQTGLACAASGTITGINILCGMPTGVTLSSPASSQILVSWTGVGGADYRVYYRPLFSYNTYFTKDVSNASSVLLKLQGNNNLYASTTYEVYVSRLDCPTTGAIGQGSSPTNVTTLPTVSCATPSIDSVRSLCPVQIEVFLHPGSSPTNNYNIYIQRITPTILAVNSYGVTGNYFTINVPYSGDQFLIAAESKCTGGGLSALYVWPGNLTIKPLCSSLPNLVLSNPTCHGFTASWNADPCLSNSSSGYELDLRVQGTLGYNSYGAPLPVAPVGPNKLVNWATAGRTYQVFVRSIYNCNGYVTYGPASQTLSITTLSSGCRDEDTQQPEETKPAAQQYAPSNDEVFTLYPNPNNGEFVADLSRYSNEEDAVRIEVINLIGQTVMTHLTTISGGHMSEFINLPTGTAAGTYIVRLTAGKNVYTAKINVSK